MRFLFLLFITLFKVFILNSAYAGLGAGPAIHDRNVVPLIKPQTQPSEKKIIRSLDPITGSLRIDDSGSRSTGFTKSTLGINFNGPFQKGETITLRQIHTSGNGSDYLEVGTRFPVGQNDSMLAFRAGVIEYNVGQQNASITQLVILILLMLIL